MKPEQQQCRRFFQCHQSWCQSGWQRWRSNENTHECRISEGKLTCWGSLEKDFANVASHRVAVPEGRVQLCAQPHTYTDVTMLHVHSRCSHHAHTNSLCDWLPLTLILVHTAPKDFLHYFCFCFSLLHLVTEFWIMVASIRQRHPQTISTDTDFWGGSPTLLHWVARQIKNKYSGKTFYNSIVS